MIPFVSHTLELPTGKSPAKGRSEQPDATRVEEAGPEPIPIAILLGSLTFGGAEKHVTCLLEGIDRSRYRPLLFLTRKWGPYLPRVEALGIPVRESGIRSVFTLAGFRGILRLSTLLRRERVRIVH